MPGKYQPLADWLAALPRASAHLTFSQIEAILGTALPPSARTRIAWWTSTQPRRTHTQAWLGVGWRATAVDHQRGLVLYRGLGAGGHPGER